MALTSNPKIMALELEEPKPKVLTAGVIYLLMKNDYCISYSVRTQWFLDHLKKELSVVPREDVSKCDLELTVVSVIPQEANSDWCPETSHLFKYTVMPSSSLVFLSQTYSIVYCLDMSPSLSAVDIQHGQVMVDDVFTALERSLDGITRPLIIPGSCCSFRPAVYVTVIAHTPFFTSPAQQVLMQGYRVTRHNMAAFLKTVQHQLELLEDTVALVSGIAHDQLEAIRAESEKLVGDLFEDSEISGSSIANIPMVTPDSGFVNMLRYGMLALRLLPETSSPNLIIITDGIIAAPDVYVFDSVLSQLRTGSTACSFLQVGSLYHPHCCRGMVPYVDLMQFIAHATGGAFMSQTPELSMSESELNIYHSKFLAWSFKKPSWALTAVGDLSETDNPCLQWHVNNSCFYGSREPRLLCKKQLEGTLSTSLISVLCCRLKEGYSFKNVRAVDSRMELSLVLPWKNHVYIEYVASAPVWTSSAVQSTPCSVAFSVSIRAPYEFLHDITCKLKKPFQSQHRQAVVSRFWATLKSLTQSDQLLAHLDSFPTNPAAHTVPESIRSGMPVFYLPANSSIPVLSSTELTCPAFAQFWRPICMLDPSVWHKWLQTHRLGLLLSHDRPLPRHLHLSNPSGRFQVVQCRQAAAALYAMLKDVSTFVLIENHSYVKLIGGDPAGFYMMRATSKLPYVVINVAFPGRTPCSTRHEIVRQLKKRMVALSVPQRPNATGRLGCCMLLRKPVEKILVRYERMPACLSTVVFPDGTQPSVSSHLTEGNHSGNPSLLTTLSRYLHHRRWIWAVQDGTSAPLGNVAVAKILAIITKMRLQEGFHFAHSAAGIVNMVLEVDMKGTVSEMNQDQAAIEPCVIQYVLFPPHAQSTSSKESGSEDEGPEDFDFDPSLQLISEVWIEPQHGSVIGSPPERSYMEGLPYFQLADKMFAVDAACISSLLAFEQLCLMCSEPDSQVPPTLSAPPIFSDLQTEAFSGLSAQALNNASLPEQRILHIPFEFNLMSILSTCHQAEQLYSTFTQGYNCEEPNQLFCTMLHESLKLIHDRELNLGTFDSRTFVDQVDGRPRDQPLPFPWAGRPRGETPRWRCYARGIAANRVTLTFVPASYRELRVLMKAGGVDEPEEPWVARGRSTSWGAAASDVHARRPNRIRTFSVEVKSRNEMKDLIPPKPPKPHGPLISLSMPIYVYDCSLAVLVDALVLKQAAKLGVKDTFRDFSYSSRVLAEQPVGERSEDEAKRSGSDEPKSDSSESLSLETSLKEQCRLVTSVLCRCFVNSLFRALHLGLPVTPDDVQSAIAECEEALIEIDITEYLTVVCSHLKEFRADESKVEVEDWDCYVPSNFPLSTVPVGCTCGDLERLHQQIKDKFKDILQQTFRRVPSYPELYFCSPSVVKTPLNESSLDDSNELKEERSDCETESCVTEEGEDLGPVSPFFLHLTCSLSCGTKIGSCPVASLPTCLAQLQPAFKSVNCVDLKKFKVTLDVLCLTLPPDAISPHPLTQPEEEEPATQFHVLHQLASPQRKSVEAGLRQVEWLIRDETAAALMDFPIAEPTLRLVADHVVNSVMKPSCLLETVPLRFVFDHEESHNRFLEMLDVVNICGYQLARESGYYYLTPRKNTDQVSNDWDSRFSPNVSQMSGQDDIKDESKEDCESECFCFDEANGGFWLVLQVKEDQVITYFHHRALATENMEGFRRIQERAVCILHGLVKSVNQTLLLNNLHSTRLCDPLLEFEGSEEEAWRSTSKFKDGTENTEPCPEFEPGCFNCEVVWETHLVLHPRLKSGPGFSRGIQALRGVLNRFSVNNRSNMFVYQDNAGHVFYLRLHENAAAATAPRRGAYEESSPTSVSRSSSLASLNAASPAGGGVGGGVEREETVVLRVHGITPAGPEVRRDLVQVLQNRLDDAVLEVLSVMLARNPMCKLTPEDVAFVQKPGRPVDQTVRFSVQAHAGTRLAALAFYLRQNLLQFLHVPKYTDPRPEAHFCDATEQAVAETDLFLYNQSPASGSKGIACLALALLDAGGAAVVHGSYPRPHADTDASELGEMRFAALTDSQRILLPDAGEAPVVEFRVWQRGRVNEPALAEKLRRAVSHALWDLLTEFRLLTTPLPDRPPIPSKVQAPDRISLAADKLSLTDTVQAAEKDQSGDVASDEVKAKSSVVTPEQVKPQLSQMVSEEVKSQMSVMAPEEVKVQLDELVTEDVRGQLIIEEVKSHVSEMTPEKVPLQMTDVSGEHKSPLAEMAPVEHTALSVEIAHEGLASQVTDIALVPCTSPLPSGATYPENIQEVALVPLADTNLLPVKLSPMPLMTLLPVNTLVPDQLEFLNVLLPDKEGSQDVYAATDVAPVADSVPDIGIELHGTSEPDKESVLNNVNEHSLPNKSSVIDIPNLVETPSSLDKSVIPDTSLTPENTFEVSNSLLTETNSRVENKFFVVNIDPLDKKTLKEDGGSLAEMGSLGKSILPGNMEITETHFEEIAALEKTSLTQSDSKWEASSGEVQSREKESLNDSDSELKASLERSDSNEKASSEESDSKENTSLESDPKAKISKTSSEESNTKEKTDTDETKANEKTRSAATNAEGKKPSDKPVTNEKKLPRAAPKTDKLDDPANATPRRLSVLYHRTALSWLRFAVELCAPSVRRHVLVLARPHALPSMARELAALVQANAADTDVWLFRSEPVASSTPAHFVAWSLNEPLESAGTNGTLILVGRNDRQWHACLDDRLLVDTDVLHPKAQKAYHKFSPLLEVSAEGELEKFVPRQRLVMAVVRARSVALFTYNWSKERSESLGKQLSTLGVWLTARTQMLANAVTQKMGLFHTRRRSETAAPPVDWDQLLKFATGGLRERKAAVRRDLYRDTKPSHLGNASPNAAAAVDVVQYHALQLQDLRANLVNKENRKKLHVMWQTRGATPNIPLAEDMIMLFRQHSRIIHYCLTPLLFLPRWRVGSAATRDHKLRYNALGSTGNAEASDPWHQQLCASFVTEYKQYLQTLGFIPIQAEPQSPCRTRVKGDESLPVPGIAPPGSHECYLQKSLLGGILLLELSMNEPFFHTKLHALECSRLQNKLSSALLMSQFTLSFVDECDRMKVLLHLHSFTYDYHLRCVQAYLSTQPLTLLRSGFHLTHFLQDFLKYYEKAPNFARNLVHADVLEVAKVVTTASQLYSYLLSHESTYNMEVFRMAASTTDAPLDNEFVLVQLWQTPHVTYRDSADVKQSGEYDVTLVVWHDDSESEISLRLEYFVILTSRKELFPKLEIERKLGKFCTVSTSAPCDSEREAATEIRRESVNYLGYYSTHEQLMARIMREQAALARSRIEDMVRRGGVDCHTHLLWDKLQCGGLSAAELVQLLQLSAVQSLVAVDKRLAPLLGQRPPFYLGLLKALAAKYPDHHRVMVSADATTTYLCVLHPRHLDAFMLLSVDQLAARGDLCAVYRKTLEGEEPSAQQQDFIRTDIQVLVEGFVNTCCYHLWVGLS